MGKIARLLAYGSALVVACPAAQAQGTASGHPAETGAGQAMTLPYASGAIADARNPWAPTLPIVRLRPLASAAGPGILNATPKVGPFALTFYSDMPVTGFDGMVNAEVVISLTRKF